MIDMIFFEFESGLWICQIIDKILIEFPLNKKTGHPNIFKKTLLGSQNLVGSLDLFYNSTIDKSSTIFVFCPIVELVPSVQGGVWLIYDLEQ